MSARSLFYISIALYGVTALAIIVKIPADKWLVSYAVLFGVPVAISPFAVVFGYFLNKSRLKAESIKQMNDQIVADALELRAKQERFQSQIVKIVAIACEYAKNDHDFFRLINDPSSFRSFDSSKIAFYTYFMQEVWPIFSDHEFGEFTSNDVRDGAGYVFTEHLLGFFGIQPQTQAGPNTGKFWKGAALGGLAIAVLGGL